MDCVVLFDTRGDNWKTDSAFTMSN